MVDSTKLAVALSALESLQRGGRSVFRSGEFSRLQRERLTRAGYLQPVMPGWVLSTSPTASAGDSTPWYASFWEFVGAYCENRFGDGWHLAPLPSLFIEVEDWSIPVQLLVYATRAGSRPIELPFGCSLLVTRPSRPARDDECAQVHGLRILTTEAAFARLPESAFRSHPLELRTALATRVDVSRLLRVLLDASQPVVAGRLAGALRHVGRGDQADEVIKTMRAADHDVRETDPFNGPPPRTPTLVYRSPLSVRLADFWGAMRADVLREFPPPPGRVGDVDAYMARVDDGYSADAYHSLSIEGYRVSEALIEKVRSGRWKPEGADKDSRDAMAAKGYALAFGAVRSAVRRAAAGENPGAIARAEHMRWYRELFGPSVAAGLLQTRDLAGYRNGPVFIRASRHVPPRAEAVPAAMQTLFELLERESEPAVLAVLGHWLFGYVHPYQDGNGRMARFLMNVMLAAGGHAWTVIRVEDRDEYLQALEQASVGREIVPFARFLASRVGR
ncbi:Fic family protein [bacterium]|nr:Fic family protein [bacterium]